MDKNRAIAWALGFIVFLTMIMAVRSCSQSPVEKKSDKKEELPELYINKNFDINVQSNPESVNTAPVEVDIFGRPVTTTTVLTEESFEEETTTLPPETDDFGNIITTVTTFETDIFGNEVTTVTTFETDIFGNVVTTEETTTTTLEEIPDVTTTLSPFEQYQQDLDDLNSISGFNHAKRDENGNPVPTAPSEFVIVIN